MRVSIVRAKSVCTLWITVEPAQRAFVGFVVKFGLVKAARPPAAVTPSQRNFGRTGLLEESEHHGERFQRRRSRYYVS